MTSGHESSLIESGNAKTHVGIIGAGPSGLLIGNLLSQAGIPCIIIESRSKDYIESRARAGLIEHGVVEILKQTGLAHRLLVEGVPHTGCEFRANGQRFSLPYSKLALGRHHYVYPQQELVKDMLKAFCGSGGDIRFETAALTISEQQNGSTVIQTTSGQIVCEFVAGCDGFHGVTRDALPALNRKIHSKQYSMGLIAILAEAPPSTKEIIYAVHERGFAGHMLRTATESRYYLQCSFSDTIENWPDERIWEELDLRLKLDEPWKLTHGPIIEKRMLDMRSMVCEPMNSNSLYLVGDAAHLLTPMGAKGMNLALSDAVHFVDGIQRNYRQNDRSLLQNYSSQCLERAWEAQSFSDWFIGTVFTTFHEEMAESFLYRLQLARLEHLRVNTTAASSFAASYIGSDLPIYTNLNTLNEN